MHIQVTLDGEVLDVACVIYEDVRNFMTHIHMTSYTPRGTRHCKFCGAPLRGIFKDCDYCRRIN